MAELHFDITGDNKQLLAALQQAQQAINNSVGAASQGGQQVDREMNKAAVSIETAFKRVGAAVGGMFAISKAKEFATEIINVRKEYQSLELSFQALLGSAEKGKQLFNEITQFAVSTPMNERDLAKGAQTLLGFNIEAEKVMPILQQIGDISMADSQKFQSLTLAFAQASSTGKLMGQDLLQMVNAGFNPLSEISRTTGQSMSDLKDKMSKGEITVQMLEGAFRSATSEGGKFHGMLSTMAQGLAGSFNSLQGAVQKLFNDLGKEAEEPLVAGANAATKAVNSLAENLRIVGAAIQGIVVTYGTYKAAAMVATVADTAHIAALTAKVKALFTVKQATQALTAAQLAANKALAANVYVAAATAIAAVGMAMYAYSQRATGAELAQKALNGELSKLSQAQDEANKKAQESIAIATDEAQSTNDRAVALGVLEARYPSIIAKYQDEEGHLIKIAALKREIAQAEGLQTVGKLNKAADTYKSYAQVANLALKGRTGMKPADIATLEKAQAEFVKQTGSSEKYNYGRIRDYYTTKAKGVRNAANTKQTQADVDAFGVRVEAMNTKQLKQWKANLEAAATAISGGKAGRTTVANIKGISQAVTGEQVQSLLEQVNARLTPIAKTASTATKAKSSTSTSKTKTADQQAARREKLSEEVAILERENADKGISLQAESATKKAEALRSAYEKELEKLQRQAAEWARENTKANVKGTASVTLNSVKTAGLTERQAAAINNAQDTALQQYEKDRKEAQKEALQSEIEYLRNSADLYEQYRGAMLDLEQRRKDTSKDDVFAQRSLDREEVAISQDYNAAIFRVQNGLEDVWQHFSSLSVEALQKLKKDIEGALTGGDISKEFANELRAKLAEVEDAMNKSQGGLFSEGGLFGKNGLFGGTWIAGIGQQLDQRKQATKTNANAEADVAMAKTNLAAQMAMFGEKSQQVLDAQARLSKAQANADNTKTSLKNIKDSIKQTFGDLGIHGVNDNVQSLNDATSLLFGRDSSITKTMQDFANSSKYATAAFDSLKNGDVIGAVAGIGQAFNSLGEGFGLWGNSNYEDWESENNKLITAQNVLTNAVNNLADKMGEGTAGEAYETYEAMLRAQNTSQQNTVSQMQNNSALYNGGHSIRSIYNDDGNRRQVSQWLLNTLADVTGNASYRTHATDLQSMLSIDAKDLEKLYQTTAGTDALRLFVQSIRDSQNGDNYGAQGDLGQDFLDYINSYGTDAYEKLKDQFYETVTGLSFDSFRDNFVSMLMDLDTEVDDFADNFTEAFTKSLMTDYVQEQYKDKIESVYNQWAALLQNRNNLSAAEFQRQASTLQNAEAQLSADMIATRDYVASVTGYSDTASQKATQSSIEGITQDQADQLIGRITAIQIASEASKQAHENGNAIVAAALNNLNANTAATNQTLNNMLLQNVQSNAYLADILKMQKGIYSELSGRIERITNTLEKTL